MSRLAPLVLPLLVAGCGPPWTVIQQSGPPSALTTASTVTVHWDASDLVVDGVPLDERMAQSSTDEAADLDSAVRAMEQIFVGELSAQMPVPISVAVGAAAPGEVRLVARPIALSRGDRGPLGSATELTMQLDWMLGPDVVDAIRVTRAQAPSTRQPRISRRMRLVAGVCGRLAASFFEAAQGH